MLEKIKNRFFKSVLRQRNTQQITRKVTNLHDATTIGIAYDSTNPDNDIAVTKFAELLRSKGKTVTIIGFVNDKKIDHKGDISIFNRSETNWYGIPNSEKADRFIDQKFDLLLVPLTDACPPIEYISFLANAKYRVGPFHEEKAAFFDLMINTGEDNNINYILQQMLFFLNSIKY